MMKFQPEEPGRVSVQKLNLERYLNKAPGWQQDCFELVNSLRNTGCSYVHDPRTDYRCHPELIEGLQKYYTYKHSQSAEEIPETELGMVKGTKIFSGFQRPYQAQFANFKQAKQALKPEHSSHSPLEAPPDSCTRVRWLLNSQHNIYPQQFEPISKKVNHLANMQLQCGLTIAQMLTVGLGLQKENLREKIERGNHLLNPPGHNLSQMKQGDLIMAFHIDISFITVHHRNKFGGLYFWTPSGTRFKPQTPENHYLIHGGKMLEWLTGGLLKAPFHEVYYDSDVDLRKKRAIEANESAWRIATPLFIHLADDQALIPLQQYASSDALENYPSTSVQDYYTQYIGQHLLHK